MSESRLERMAPLTGVVFVGLVVAGTVLINNYEFLPPGEELKSFYEDNSGTARLGHFLLMGSSAFLICARQAAMPPIKDSRKLAIPSAV